MGVSVWLRRSKHTHTHTHNCGSVPAGGQSLPSSYTFILSLFPSVLPPPFPPIRPLFLLHPLFLLVAQTAPPTFERREKKC